MAPSDDGPAKKHDAGKPRYDLISPFALEALATVLAYGAKKYGDRNWEKGVGDPQFAERVFAAGQRHAWAPRRGEGRDEETGYPHSWHELTNAMFKVHYEAMQAAKPPEMPAVVVAELIERAEQDDGDMGLRAGEAYTQLEIGN
jgi:hypothetical protein